MKFIAFLFLCVSLTNHTFCQSGKAYAATYEPDTEFILRGKVLGMVFIEDEWASAFSLGAEILFVEQFSIVADIVHMRYKHEREVPITPGDYTSYNEYWQKDTRSYMAFEMRYYPYFLQFDLWKLYVNGFSKVGARFLHSEDLYPLNDNEVKRLNSNFYDFGSSLGFRFGDWWGFDLNIGAAYRNELKNEDIHHYDDPENYTEYTKNVIDARWTPNIRASFFFNLTRY